MSEPKVSIIIATFNRAHMILECMGSILNQNYGNWECLIIDDGSKDKTKEILKPFIQKQDRFFHFQRPNSYKKGLPGSRNYGLDLAKGQYVVFFDDDDIVHPDLIKTCVEKLEEAQGVYFCHYKKRSFTSEPPVIFSDIEFPTHYHIGKNEYEEVVSQKLSLASCTVLWKKECFETLRFNETLQYAEEWELYTRILGEGYYGIGINEVLYYNRKHEQSNTGEFWQGDKSRRDSYEKAIKLVIDYLHEKNNLSKKLFRYFVQLSIFLKNQSILNYLFKTSNSGVITRIKYHFLYKFYPVLVIGHRTKNLIKKKLS